MEYALSVIDTLRKGWYNPPYSYRIRKSIFASKSYSSAGLREIELYLTEHESEDPIIALENFRHMMDDFSSRAKSDSAKFMFSTYYDVAGDVLDVLLPFSQNDEMSAYIKSKKKEVLKTALNSVYGLASAKFENN